MEISSIFKPYEKYECWRGDTQKVLKSSIGRQLPFIVNFKKNTCQIFDVELERITHAFTFPEGSKLIDVDYFPTPEGQLGILVGVEDEQQTWGYENFVVALAADSEDPAMRVTHSAAIPVKITRVKTLFSAVDMVEGNRHNTLGLFHRLLEWPHIIAIGCKEARLYLARLPDVASNESIVIHDPKKSLTNLMSSFVQDETLMYTLDDGCYKECPVSAVYISAIALMPRSRTLLVGLSMGGILAASLNPSNQMSFLELRHERLVRELTPLEPEDDPDKFEYFIASVDRSSRHPIMMQLWRGSFKTMDHVEDDVKYDRPYFGVCLEHKIPYGERWLSLNTIVTERGGMEVTRKREDSTMDSMLNVSQSYGASLNRSNVLLAYERRALAVQQTGEPEFVVEAAVFDIDAWYYKRVPGRVTTDGTVLKQCAFMSCIKSQIKSNHVQDVAILTLNPTDAYRFPSLVSDADQLFYPSSVSYDRVLVLENNQISVMKIQSLQQTILEKCASKLPLVIRSPEAMSNNIIAAGLVRKGILSGSPNSSAAVINDSELSTDQKIILNAMVYYGKIDELCALASRTDMSDKFKKEIAEWAVHEAVDYKRIISDRTVTLFEGSAVSLSPLAEDTLLQGIKLFRVVHEYLKACAKAVKDNGKLNSYANSAKCLRNHTKLVSRFIGFRLVPANFRTQQTMREMHEKRKTQAMKNKTALPIQVVTRNMHRLAPEGQFWNDMPHEEWYPPTPLDLLESVLTVSISERLKRELIVQFILDWLRADPAHAEDTDKQLAIETVKIMTNKTLDVDLEKVYYVLDEERGALKKKTVSSGQGVKVFSLQDDGLTYEKLWSGEIHLVPTISKNDLERFEQRLKQQIQRGDKKGLTVLDPETEMLYQMFLFEKQKYDLMSAEAIESNSLLRTFLPGMVQRNGRGKVQKTAREKEIEQSVKAMFEKQEENNESDLPEMFAVIGDKHGKKRKSEAFDNTSPVNFVPPTAKRIQPWNRPQLQQNDSLQEKSVVSSVASPADPQGNAEINMMIATPARYYKRPVTVSADMMSPPTQRLPPVPTQNSILKTAKAVQSPSRGRIRFHESVRRGANESIESSTEEMQEEEEEVAPRPRGLNFAILEDEEEEDISTRRSIIRENQTPSTKEPIQEEEEDECVEMEKSYETAEDEPFEVLEEHSNEPVETEETFEMRVDDVIPGTDETFDLTEREDFAPKVVEPVQISEEVQDDETDEPMEEKTEEVQEEMTPELQTEEVQEEVTPELVTEEVQQDEVQQDNQETPSEELQESEEVYEEDQAPWDGIHRSFELQHDEDCDPVEDIEKDQFEDATDDLAQEIPLNRTFEVQDDDPQPKADVPDTEAPTTVPEPYEVKILEAPDSDEDRPPSANTRAAVAKRANSRSATPVEENVKETAEESTKQSRTRRARTVSVQKTTEVQEENGEERPLSRRTRAASVKKTAEIQEEPEKEEKTPSRKTRASSVSRKIKEVQNDSEGSPIEEDRPPSRNTRAASVKKDSASLPVVPEEEPPRKTPRRAASVKRGTTEDREVSADTTIKSTRASSVKRAARSRTTSEAAPQDTPVRATRSRANSRSTTPSRAADETKKSTKGMKVIDEERAVTPTNDDVSLPDLTGSTLMKKVSAKRNASSTRAASVSADSRSKTPEKAPQSSAPNTPRRGRPAKAKKDETPASSKKNTSKRRSSESDEIEEPPKKSRGRPRNTPLKVIPEVGDEPSTSTATTTSKRAETPKRGGSRSRNNSESTVTTTPKRGRKPIGLDELVEENEDGEPIEEPLTPRRSSRRLTSQK